MATKLLNTNHLSSIFNPVKKYVDRKQKETPSVYVNNKTRVGGYSDYTVIRRSGLIADSYYYTVSRTLVSVEGDDGLSFVVGDILVDFDDSAAFYRCYKAGTEKTAEWSLCGYLDRQQEVTSPYLLLNVDYIDNDIDLGNVLDSYDGWMVKYSNLGNAAAVIRYFRNVMSAGDPGFLYAMKINVMRDAELAYSLIPLDITVNADAIYMSCWDTLNNASVSFNYEQEGHLFYIIT